MKVSDLMTREVVTCPENAMLGEAVRLMWDHRIGFLPVVSDGDGALVGVITDRDAALAAWLHDKPIREIPVRAVMSVQVGTCGAEAEIDEAELRMSELQVRRLPVIGDRGQVVGVISLDDVARQAAGKADAELEEEVALTLGAIAQPRANDAR